MLFEVVLSWKVEGEKKCNVEVGKFTCDGVKPVVEQYISITFNWVEC